MNKYFNLYWPLYLTSQQEGEKEADTSSQALDLGFPEDDEDGGQAEGSGT